jgi:hypothetical protein
VVQPHLAMPIPLTEEDCVTKRFYVNVFQPVASTSLLNEDSEPSVDVIEIAEDEIPSDEYQPDDDAVTKEIRIQRLGAITSSGLDHAAAMRVRTLPTDDTLWRSGSARRLGEKTGLLYPIRLMPIFPSVRAALKRIFSAVFWLQKSTVRSVNRSFRSKKASSSHKPGTLRLSVNTYTKDLYREIRRALNPNMDGAELASEGGDFSVMVSTPPQIAVNAMLLRRADKYSLLIRGRASHPIAIRDIMVFADKKKILYLSNAARDDAGYMEFSADVPLEAAVGSILVVARHDDHVMGSQSLVIKKSN